MLGPLCKWKYLIIVKLKTAYSFLFSKCFLRSPKKNVLFIVTPECNFKSVKYLQIEFYRKYLETSYV